MKHFWLFFGIIFLGGCSMRTYTIEKLRGDTEVEGNRGYLVGTPKEEVRKRWGETRKISVVEVELGGHQFQKPTRLIRKATPAQVFQEETVPQQGKVTIEEGIYGKKSYEYYTVQENDTLQKISRKFYGTIKKWELIYEENRDVLESPDKIYPGMKIKVPVLD